MYHLNKITQRKNVQSR